MQSATGGVKKLIFLKEKETVVYFGHLILYLISELGQLTVQLHVYWVLQEWLLAGQG